MLLARLLDGAVAYDAHEAVLHHLSLTAGLVLAACDGVTELRQLIDELTTVSDAPSEELEGAVSASITALAELGLVGRIDAPAAAAGVTDHPHPQRGGFVGADHAMLDVVLRFRSPNQELLDEIDAFLGTGAPVVSRVTAPGDGGDALPATQYIDVEERSDGKVHLLADSEWLFPDRPALFRQLVGVVNELARSSRTCLSLHASAVRSPAGKVVVLPGDPGSGKSTMAGAFILAGWDYLGDEVIGIRENGLVAVGYPKRLALDESSQRFLTTDDHGGGARASVGDMEAAEPALDVDPASLRSDVVRLSGDVAAVDLVVFPSFDPDGGGSIVPLDPIDTFNALAANAQNLACTGAVGLRTLCQLAERVPGYHLRHDDARVAVTTIAGLLDATS